MRKFLWGCWKFFWYWIFPIIGWNLLYHNIPHAAYWGLVIIVLYVFYSTGIMMDKRIEKYKETGE